MQSLPLKKKELTCRLHFARKRKTHIMFLFFRCLHAHMRRFFFWCLFFNWHVRTDAAEASECLTLLFFLSSFSLCLSEREPSLSRKAFCLRRATMRERERKAGDRPVTHLCFYLLLWFNRPTN